LLFAYLRIALFAGIVFLLYTYFSAHKFESILISILLVIVFILVLLKVQKLNKNLVYFQNLIDINNNELNCLQGDYSKNYDGEGFADLARNSFASDLDIIGKKSVFQFINRSKTLFGHQKLFSFLCQPQLDEIVQQQSAIQELMEQTEFRQEILGKLPDLTEKEIKSIRQIVGLNLQIGTIKKLVVFFPVVAVSALIYGIAAGNFTPFLFAFLLNLITTSFVMKTIKSTHQLVDKLHHSISLLSDVFEVIEKTVFVSYKLKELQGKFKFSETENASTGIRKLKNILASFDSIYNPLGALIMNGVFLYHTNCLILMQKWTKKYGPHVEEWLNAMGALEAYISFSTTAFNNKEDVIFPSLSATSKLQMEGIVHPLLNYKKGMVSNSIYFDKKTRISILTGSNMAGKSTFLRTVGVNLVLANSGMAVFAKIFEFYPMEILASIHINDSLLNNESYFFAELKKLKRIKDTIDSGKECFFLLDEILRGTNSLDKQLGTMKFLEALNEFPNALGIIATHDVEVTKLAEKFTTIFNNFFSFSITNADELVFDYKLKNGVCQNMNAQLLLRKMNIIK
jgi:hypothetical protein